MPFVAVPDHLAGDVFTLANWQTHIEGNLNSGVERPLYDIILGSAAASVDITSIPATFAHLRVVFQARGDTAAANVNVNMRFNNDSAANYASQYVRGLGATASAVESNSGTSSVIGAMAAATATANHASSWEIIIPNYAGTTFFKGWSSFGGFTQTLTTLNLVAQENTGVWVSTTAINRVTLLPTTGNFATGSRFTLLGVPYI